ncbi:fumarylacetoacetate hydrolase family protein [Henriciella aquimarina]|uniref:fumarylacetoacetate hydrolase family protein n=1 Tax=Henriciella aquimarina TaxID=545261 RepID=UPI000A05DEDD|nr:fumarylacetoacetate hydrolase family protein [Henriciella aquimarina]
MRLLNFMSETGPRLGLQEKDEVIDLTEAGLPSTLDELVQSSPDFMARASSAAASSTVRHPLAGIDYLPPFMACSKAIAVGLNYVDHAAEADFEPPAYPVLFNRYPSSWVGHKHPLIRPKVSDMFDYEGELVIVIGKAGRHITKADALDHVAGYSIFNDGSIRDYQMKSGQWLMGKNFDQSGSFGPAFVTADELPLGASGLHIETRLNGEVMQSASTDQMIFDVPTLIACISEAFTLRPGDIIISGTPAGVGVARDPKVFMKPGDVCEVEIEGLGVLSNTVADET